MRDESLFDFPYLLHMALFMQTYEFLPLFQIHKTKYRMGKRQLRELGIAMSFKYPDE
ncbi:hypothetical protein D3C71_1951860 [compost metagenome]